MIRAASTYAIVHQRLQPGLLDAMARAGATAIEIFGARGHFDYSDRQHVREIAAWFKTSGVAFNSLHAPMFSDYDWGRDGTPPLNLVDADKRRRIASMDEIKRAIEVAEQVPFRFLVQHLGTPGESFDEHKFEYALSAIEHLHAFAKPLGVTLLVENIPNELATPEHLVELLRAGHFSDVGMCFDLGHAHVMSNVADAFATMKPHIRSTHVHDNKKDRDSHLWPGDGTIDWDEAMGLLRSAPHVPPLVLEIEGEHLEADALAKGTAEAFRKLEAVKTPVAESP